MCWFNVEYIASEGMLPVRSSLAIGQPPQPPMAESNLLQPASQAANIFSCAVCGVVCRCALNCREVNCAFKAVKALEMIMGSPTPMVSESAMHCGLKCCAMLCEKSTKSSGE